jgi:hypothetical protein
MDTIAPSALLVALVFTVINWFRYLSGRDWNGVITQLCVWGGGVVAVFLFANTDFADASIPGTAISFAAANGWSLLFIGLTIGSSASVVTEVVKAVDNTRSSAKPKLLRVEPPPVD